jgi:hypothetical protein
MIYNLKIKMIYFLKAKNWQLFLLMVGIPLLLEIYFFKALTVFFLGQNNTIQLWPLPLGVFITWVIWATWVWSVGHFLYKKLPDNIELNLNSFKMALILPTIFLIVFFCFLLNGINYEQYIGQNGRGESIGFSAAKFYFQIILGFNLLSVFQILYALYFCGKAYKSIEMKKEAHLGDYFAEIILFCFYFVGVWFLQPKINAFYEGYTEGGIFKDDTILDI